jgi:hypothetical protein
MKRVKQICRKWKLLLLSHEFQPTLTFLEKINRMETCLRKRILEQGESDLRIHEDSLKKARLNLNQTVNNLENFVEKRLNQQDIQKLIELCLAVKDSQSAERHLSNNVTMTNFDVAHAFFQQCPIVSAFESTTLDPFLDSFLKSQEETQADLELVEFSVPISIDYRRGGYKFREVVSQEIPSTFDAQEAICDKLHSMGILEKPVFPNWSKSLECVSHWATERAILEGNCDLRDSGGEGSEEVEFEFWYVRLRKVQ